MTEGPYKLPEGWRWVRLGEVCEICDHLRKPVKKKDRIPGEVPYCGANGVIDYVSGFTHEGEFVLLAEDGGFYGPGEPSAYMMFGRFWANNHIHILLAKSDYLMNAFLQTYLVAADLRPFLTGATRAKLTQRAMTSIPIPLPPLAEQRRIVARIEALMARVQEARRLRQEAREEAERLWQSVLADTFPRPGSALPPGWRWVRLADAIVSLSNGTTAVQNRAGVGIPVTRIETIRNEVIDPKRVGYIREPTEALMAKFRLNIGDILFSHINSDPHLGKTAVYLGEPAVLLHGMNLIRIVPKKDSVDSAFLNYLFKCFRLQGVFVQIAQRAIGQSSINQTKMKNLPIPLPPLAEQRRIVAHLEGVQEKIRALQAAQAETEEQLKHLEQSILDKAFRGQL
jgi:type I restriction enzyme S subunit